MKYLIKNKHWNIVEDYNLDKLLYLLIDRPDLINGYNSFVWKSKKNEHHRNYDFPCFMSSHGDLEWRINDRTHRSNKSAIIWANGDKE